MEHTNKYDNYHYSASSERLTVLFTLNNHNHADSLPDIFNPSCLKLIPFPLLLLNSLFLTVLATPDEYRSEYRTPSPSCRLFTIRTFSKACREKSTCSAVKQRNAHVQFKKIHRSFKTWEYSDSSVSMPHWSLIILLSSHRCKKWEVTKMY